MSWLEDPIIGTKLIDTAFVVGFVLLLRFVFGKLFKSSRMQHKETRRSWIVAVNNLATLLIVLGLVVIWATELQSFVVSLVALAVALVIATKEFILNFTAGIYKSFVKPFRVGDRIQVGDIRGEVIGNHFLSVDLLEVGPGENALMYTGRTVSVPNATFLTLAVMAESRTADYRLHSFVLKLPNSVRVTEVRSQLLTCAVKVCESYLNQAKEYIDKAQKHEGLDVPDVNPNISIHYCAKDEIEFVVRLPVPALGAARKQQEVLKLFSEMREQSESL